MSIKKSSKQKNTRHHLNTVPAIAKKKTKKAKLLNHDLLANLDKTTGLIGAAKLFASPTKPATVNPQPQSQKVETEKTVEEDILALISMKLSSTKAH